jgi:hypothetical protein
MNKCKSFVKVVDQVVKDFDSKIIGNIIYDDMEIPNKDSSKMKR